MSEDPISVFDLSPEKKLALIAELWGDLSANHDRAPVPDWHPAELDRRLSNRLDSTENPARWDEVKLRLSNRSS